MGSCGDIVLFDFEIDFWCNSWGFKLGEASTEIAGGGDAGKQVFGVVRTKS